MFVCLTYEDIVRSLCVSLGTFPCDYGVKCEHIPALAKSFATDLVVDAA